LEGEVSYNAEEVLIGLWQEMRPTLEEWERMAERTPCPYCEATPEDDGGITHGESCPGDFAHRILMYYSYQIPKSLIIEADHDSSSRE
jgi:hypothetical protein